MANRNGPLMKWSVGIAIALTLAVAGGVYERLGGHASADDLEQHIEAEKAARVAQETRCQTRDQAVKADIASIKESVIEISTALKILLPGYREGTE